MSNSFLICVELPRVRPEQDLALFRRRAEGWFQLYTHVSLARSWIDSLIADWHKVITAYHKTSWNNTGVDTPQEAVGHFVQRWQFCVNTTARLEEIGWETVSWLNYYLRLSQAITETMFPKDSDRLSGIKHLQDQVRNVATSLHEMGDYRQRATIFLVILGRLSKGDRQQARTFIASLPMDSPDIHAASVASAMCLAAWKPWLLMYVYKELASRVSDYELQEYASKFFGEMWNVIARPVFDSDLVGRIDFLAAIFPEARERIVLNFKSLLFGSSRLVYFEQWHRVAAGIFDTIQDEMERIDRQGKIVSLDEPITTDNGESVSLAEILEGASDVDEGQWEFADAVAKVADNHIRAAIILMLERDFSPREAVQLVGLPYDRAVKTRLRKAGHIIVRAMSG